MTLDLPPGPITLLPDKSLLLAHSRTLILADTHFGKSAAFRARGLPVPEGDTARDLRRIDALFEQTNATHLVIAGDILHAKVGCAPEILEQLLPWLEKRPVTLIEGNHDTACGKQPLGPNNPLLPEITIDGFHILHNPDEVLDQPDGFHLGGHLHPSARIKDGTGTGFRTDVFWLRHNQLILPAFGSFTGGQNYPFNHQSHRLFTPLNNRVVELPSTLW
ncbi:MAG: ligase-associated DNA damage response endonuclease PdeM [Verrucomicrobiota bacterium]